MSDGDITFESIADSLDGAAHAINDVADLVETENVPVEVYRALSNLHDAVTKLMAMLQLMAGAQP